MQRQAVSTARTVSRAVVFVCVCVSLWRAPLPWLHHHESRSVGAFGTQLSRHLDMWHCRDASDESGWHLHFALLDDILRGGGCPVPPDENENELPLTIGHVVPGDHVVSVAKSLLSPVHSLIVWKGVVHASEATVARTDLLRRRHADEQAEPRRLLTLLCVALR